MKQIYAERFSKTFAKALPLGICLFLFGGLLMYQLKVNKPLSFHQINHQTAKVLAENYELAFLPGKFELKNQDKTLGGVRLEQSKEVEPIVTNNAVVYKGIYEGIDWKFYGKGKGKVAYDFILEPGANPEDIRMELDNVDQTYIDPEGSLIVAAESGRIKHTAPMAYQEIAGGRVEVESRFVLEDGFLGFEVGDYNASYAVIIDPTINFEPKGTFAPSEISGTVFEDYNANGSQDVGEPGVSDIVVNGYADGDAVGAPSYTATTGLDGTYMLTGVSGGENLRLEFIVPATKDYLAQGAAGATSVVFASEGDENVDVGFNNPNNYSSANPILATPCYALGLHTDPRGGLIDALVGVPYNWGRAPISNADNDDQWDQNGNPIVPFHYAINNQIGTTYGVAWDRTSNTIYLSAFQKKHTDFGPEGPGAIYQMTIDPLSGVANSAPSLFVDVDDFAGITVCGSHGDDLFPASDPATANLVGKCALGDIDISDDNTKLYTVNLNGKEIIEIDIATGNMTNSWVFPALSGNSCYACTVADDVRPFGLKYRNGKVYVGGICSSEITMDDAELNSFIYELDPTMSGAGAFSEFFCFNWNDLNNDSNYWRDGAFQENGSNGGLGWHNFMFSDIEFYGNDLVMGFRDRQGDMRGKDVPGVSLDAQPRGEIITAWYNTTTGQYVLESNVDGAAGPARPGSGANQGGSGITEFYIGDGPNDLVGDGNVGARHFDQNFGGLAQVNTGDIVMSSLTPRQPFDIGQVESGGFGWLSNISGQAIKSFTLYSGNGTDPGDLLGKAAGLGDVEGLTTPAPIEIGDYVWVDTDSDGVQDPDEAAIPGVSVGLYKNGNLVNTTITDGNGRYYFTSEENSINQGAYYGAVYDTDDDSDNNKAVELSGGGGVQNGSFSINGQFRSFGGLHYEGVNIPNGATITNAFVQFMSENTGLPESDPSSVNFFAEAIDDSPSFANINNNLSSRTLTTAFVRWDVPAFTLENVQSANERSPDLSAVIQEIVNRPGWSSGNDLSLLIEREVDGNNGNRSVDGESNPYIVIEWTGANVGGTNMENIVPNMDYEVRLDLTQAPITSNSYSLTTDNSSSSGSLSDNSPSSDIRDSDASQMGNNAVIAFTTGNWGENNHGLDFGFSSCPQPTADAPTVMAGNCDGSTPMNDATVSIANIMNADIAGISSAGAAMYDGPDYNSDASTDPDLYAVTTTFSESVFEHGQDYIIRLFNAENACFTDVMVTTATIDCNTSVTCPTTCASGEMRLSFADAGWNNGAGWTDNATTPQTYMNFDGLGNNVSLTLSGNAPGGGTPGPNVYTTNPAGCTEALRLAASSTSNSIADFPTETISFDNPIDFRKMYVGGMEQRNVIRNAEVSVLTFSNGGTPIDPNNFTYTPLDAAHVDYAILNNVLYVYGILEDENGVLSIESNGILVDEIVWAIGEIEDNAVSVENFDFSGGASSQWITPICYLPAVVSNCALSLAATQASCTDNMDGSFTATYDVEVSWMDAPGDAGEMINVTLDGGNTMSIDPTTMTSPQTVQFTVDADGTGTHTIAAEFSSDATCNASTTFKAPVPCVTDLGFTPGDVCNNLTAGAIGGTVWEDFNYNGIQDETTIVGVAGVQVNVTGCDGTALGTTYTDANGNWVFDISAAPSCNGCNDVQIEYIMPETVSCWAKVTQAGTDNGTMIQFVGEGNCASMGVAAPVDYCQTNPTLGIACYVNGLGTNDTDGFLTIDYNSSGTEITDPYNAIATTEAIGSVWGSAYQRSQERLFNATFLKRHTGMADGPGYVYYFNVNPDNGNLVGGINSFNLEGVSPANVGSALGGTGTIQLGSICRDGSCGSPASDYTLPANPADPSVDLDAFGKVGKISFGDIDLQEDGNTLWMTNVNSDQLSLISVDVSGANPLGTVNRYLLDNMGGVPSCTNGEPRIWALKFHKGRGYLGLICDASISQNSSDLEGYILSFDPQNMGAGFNIELNYSLNYDNNPSLSGGQWYAWVDNWADKLAVDADPKVHPQPLVSDIEFDEEGNMLIGHMDRFPHQRAVDNHFPLSGNTDVNTNAFAWGDLIKACKTSTGYEVAGSGSCPTNFLNGVGPFGNGFFHSLRRGDEAPVGFGGAMAVLRGSDELLATYVDPIPPGGTFGAPEFLDVQGLQWFSNTTGDKTDSYRVYRSGFPFFGKGYGLGDIELMCDPAPLEIGNYVWEDIDQDGLQDACEPGIPGVSVELYDAAGTTLIGVATTNMNGQYYFNATNVDENGVMPDGSATVGFTGLSPNTSYVVQITNAEGGSQQAALTGFELTATDANGNNSDKIDNDASSDGTNASIMAMTADAGCNDHSFDFGFIQSCIEPSAITLSQGAATCDMLGLAENNGTISLATATDGTHYGISTLNAGTYDGPTTVGAATMIPASLPSVVQMNIPNTGGSYIVRIFNTDDDCFVEETVVVNAVVCDCVDPILTSLTDESICEGGSFTAANVTTSVTNSIPVTYQWYNNNGSDNPTTDALNGQTTAVLTALPTAAGSYSYRVEATSTLDGSCNASETVNLTIHPQPDIDDLADVNICSGDSYELPMITGSNLTGNEGYYTGSGGTGMQLNVGDMITTAQTIYIYDITATMPMCNDEESFTVSIIPNPDVADLEDQIICAGESYELPMITGTNLTGNEGYYTGPGGSGTALNVGDMITTSQTIYIYDATATMPVCSDEESFTVTVLELDLGDLPTTYPTLLANDGARHCVPSVPELYLGSTVDTESEGQASNLADGDDATDDEDGVVFTTPMVPGSMACVEVSVVNDLMVDAYLQAWVDFNGDDTFDDGEELLSGDFTGSGIVINPGGVNNQRYCFEVPVDATFAEGMAFVRFRLSSAGGLSYDGFASDGEVEDYKLNLGKIGNLVFEDYDFDGIQDAGEPGIDGVTVGLTWFGADGVEGGGDDVVYTDLVTGSGDFDTGEYYFCGLSDGSYKVTFTTPENMTPTRTDIGGNNEQDSDGVLMGMDLSRVMETFTIAEATMLPTDESGNGDNGTTPTNGFADEQTDETHDQGFAFLDYGDLPDDPMDDTDYPTLMEEGGAVHVVIDELYLGGMVDGEQDGQPSALADGDDADEDGIVFATPLIPGNEACIEVTAVNTTGSDATLQGWIDWDGNGMLDAGEALSLTNNGVVSGSISGESFCFEVPSDAAFNSGMVLARFRLSPNGGLMAAGPDKFDEMTTVPQGEVEDYKLNLGKIGNLVFEDYDFDGIQDGGEPGIDGVTVGLTWFGADGVEGGGDDVVYTDLVTGSGDFDTGEYYFCGLSDGSYKVTFTTPENMTPTRTDIGGNNEQDSDGVLMGMDLSMVMETFTIAEATMLPTDESGTGDNGTTPTNGFADEQTDETHDQGFAFLDYGDLPDDPMDDTDYPTLMEEGGAVHVMIDELYLGGMVDGEQDGQPSALADGDDADEDGIVFATPLIPGNEACIEVTAVNTTGTDATLQGWIDWDGNGMLDAGEALSLTNNGVVSGSISGESFCFEVPSDAAFNTGMVLARFRLSPNGGLMAAGPDKFDEMTTVPQGEVEDYKLNLSKVGQWVWFDLNDNGIQDVEESTFGLNDVPVVLRFAGADGVFYTDDDLTYNTTTQPYTFADDSSLNGVYYYCGLIDGKYRLEVDYDEAAGLEPALADQGSEDMDSDGVELVGADSNPIEGVFGVMFEIDNEVGNREDEGGIGDADPGNTEDPNEVGSFPDLRVDQSFDFGLINTDLGDLPEGEDFDYPTVISSMGAEHMIPPVQLRELIPFLYLGDGVDADEDGAPSEDADGDNLADMNDDEDGVRLLTPLIPGYEACFEIKVTIPELPANTIGYLQGWIDFDGSGTLDADEQIITNRAYQYSDLTNGQAAEVCFTVPADAVYFEGGLAYARFRLSTQADLGTTGLAPDGEVEDYQFELLKVGNTVWADDNEDGQADPTDLDGGQTAGEPAFNGVPVQLTFAGDDNTFGTSDDRTYQTTTANLDGVDGQYTFCGLILGDYRLEVVEDPEGYIPTVDNCAEDDLDSDGVPGIEFSLPQLDQVLIEGGFGDNDDGTNFPDIRKDETFDFGYLTEPEIKGAIGIVGVDYPESEICGHFNVIFDACFKNTGGTPLRDLNAYADLSAAEYFGSTVYDIVSTPALISSDAQVTPTLNDSYDGTNNLFMDNTGLLYPGEQVCLRFVIEVNPEADEAPANPNIQLDIEAKAVNYQDKPIPDWTNGGEQYIAEDLSDGGTDPMTSNTGYPGDTGGEDDVTPLTDCWEKSRHMAANNNVNLTLNATCNMEITPDMIIENHFADCDMMALPLGGYYRVKLLTGDEQGFLTNPFDATQLVGQQIIAVVENVSRACLPVWGYITLEDKDGSTGCIKKVVGLHKSGSVYTPISNEDGDCNDGILNKSDYDDGSGNLDWEDESINLLICTDVPYIQDVASSWNDPDYDYYTGSPQLLDNCTDVTITRVADQLTDYECDLDGPVEMIEGRLVSSKITRTFYFEDTEGNEGSISQEICFFKPVIYLPECKKHLNVCVYGDSEQSNTEESLNPSVIESAPYYLNGKCEKLYLDSHTCNATVTFEDQVLPGTEHCGFKIIRTWTILDWCWEEGLYDQVVLTEVADDQDCPEPTLSSWDNKSLTYEQHLIIDDTDDPVVSCPVVDTDWDGEGDPLVYAVGPFNCSASFEVPAPEVGEEECGYSWTVRVYTEKPVLWHGVPTGEIELVEYLDATIFNQIDESTWTTEYVLLSDIPKGYYYLDYIVEDHCGNIGHVNDFDPEGDLDIQKELLCGFEVVDNTEPSAVCDDQLNVSVGSGSGADSGLGFARVYAEDVDEGSWDNCSPIWLQVRRFVPADIADLFVAGSDLPLEGYPNNPITLNKEGVEANGQSGFYTYFADYVDFICADVGQKAIIELGVWDDADMNGLYEPGKDNFNTCWLETLVEDKINPICETPHDITIRCDEVPFFATLPEDGTKWGELSESEQENIRRWFGDLQNEHNTFPKAWDNCEADVAMIDVEFDLHCKAGTVTRIFQATDASGRQSASCSQVITLTRYHDYCVIFPKDAEATCGNDPNIPGVELDEQGCDLLAISIQDERFDVPTSSDECYKIFRTYRVLNWCQFEEDLDIPGGEGEIGENDDVDDVYYDFTYFDRYTEIPPFIVSRDEDDDGNPGDENVTVRFITKDGQSNGGYGTIYVDRNCDPFDGNPSVNGGYWRKADTPQGTGSGTTLVAGFYQYTQVIKVYDQIAPVQVVSGETEFPSYTSVNPGEEDKLCTGIVTVMIEVTEECTPDGIRIVNEVVLNPDPVLGLGPIVIYDDGIPTTAGTDLFGFTISGPEVTGEFTRQFTLSGEFPIGAHELEVTVMDGCGNDDADFIDFTVFDAKAPVPICNAVLTTDLMPVDTNNDGIIDDGMIAIWASDFIASPNEDCSGPVTYSIALASEIDGGAEPDINQTSLTLGCEDVSVVIVYVYAWDTAGNKDRCEAMIIVNDNNGLCDPQVLSGVQLAGLIETEENQTVSNVEVGISGQMNDQMMTTVSGIYQFTDLQKGYDYSITPLKDVDHRNGISTFDLVVINKHILGVEPLDSPYKMIAADVNNSRSITTLDIIQLRKLILSITTNFSSNTSWRFVDASFEFPDRTNPWLTQFPELINFNDLEADQEDMDFIAVKVGDVTGDAKTNEEAATIRNLQGQFDLMTTDIQLEAGQEHAITFSSDQLDAIQGFQSTLAWTSALDFVRIESGLMELDQFGVHRVDNGILTTSWNQPTNSLIASGELFTLVVKARENILLSEVLSLNSKYTVTEAYPKNYAGVGNVMDVAIDFGNAIATASGFKLYQNIPNPYHSKTIIGFDLPTSGEATLRVFNANGQLVYELEGEYGAGYHELEFDAITAKVNGVLYYTLETEGFTATKRMVALSR